MSRILSIPEDYESHCDIVSILVCSKKKKKKTWNFFDVCNYLR